MTAKDKRYLRKCWFEANCLLFTLPMLLVVVGYCLGFFIVDYFKPEINKFWFNGLFAVILLILFVVLLVIGRRVTVHRLRGDSERFTNTIKLCSEVNPESTYIMMNNFGKHDRQTMNEQLNAFQDIIKALDMDGYVFTACGIVSGIAIIIFTIELFTLDALRYCNQKTMEDNENFFLSAYAVAYDEFGVEVEFNDNGKVLTVRDFDVDVTVDLNRHLVLFKGKGSDMLDITASIVGFEDESLFIKIPWFTEKYAIYYVQ